MMHDPEVTKFFYRMAKGGWEKWRYLDAIHDYQTIVAELEKIYAITPASNVYMCRRILSELQEAKREVRRRSMLSSRNIRLRRRYRNE